MLTESLCHQQECLGWLMIPIRMEYDPYLRNIVIPLVLA